jgi:hypothetical protein
MTYHFFSVIPCRRIPEPLRDATRSFDRPRWQAVLGQEHDAQQVRIAPHFTPKERIF